MPPELVYQNGFCSFAREAGDKMGWEGMAEIYLCLAEQYPEDSRKDPDIKNWFKWLWRNFRKSGLNKYEFANILSTFIVFELNLLPDERYPHF